MTVDISPVALSDRVRALWDEPRISTLGVVRRDGTPHLTPVRSMLEVTEDGPRLLVLTRAHTVKARAVARTGRASVAEHTPTSDWATLEGPARVSEDPDDLARARLAYAARFGEDDHWAGCVVVVDVERVLTGS